MRGAVLTYNLLALEFARLWQSVGHLAPATVLTPALLIGSLVTIAGWLWAMEYTTTRRHRVMYQIPVRFH